MSSKELFEDFCLYFPQKSGYIVVNKLFDGTVVFTPNQEVADAFLTARKISAKAAHCLFAAIFFVLISCVFLVWGMGDGKLFGSWDSVITFLWFVLSVPSVCGIYVMVINHRRRKLKKIYRNKVVSCRRHPVYDHIEYQCY